MLRIIPWIILFTMGCNGDRASNPNGNDIPVNVRDSDSVEAPTEKEEADLGALEQSPNYSIEGMDCQRVDNLGNINRAEIECQLDAKGDFGNRHFSKYSKHLLEI